MKLTRRFSQGFTLIEVLIAISIVAFLTAFIIPYFRSQMFKANDARRKADLKRISQALEEYEKDFSCYPAGVGSLVSYINSVPRDPVFKTAYPYEVDGTACSAWYRLYSRLENTKDPDYQISVGPAALPKIYNFVITSPNAP